LGGVVIKIPPLVERHGDIPLLVNFFLKKYGVRLKKDGFDISPEAMAMLNAWPWPGNVREMSHVIHAAVVVADAIVLPEHLEHLLYSRNRPAGTARTDEARTDDAKFRFPDPGTFFLNCPEFL